ncbi:hypothetical protein AVEN_204195-1 [Araneus ventricosus]|uniref:Uncharacterized protein n=1 Tax=Araneus ventricosus TaxID=182803 RepID=A0A4Y2S680_ARAVE|nr:hypothetical protein AVEN_204195-1 [Araneus ventricosus]
MVVFFTRLGSVTKILVVGGLGQRGFRLRKERGVGEGKKKAALAPGRIRNFAADYRLGRAGDVGFGRERPCRSTHLLNEYAGRWADTRGFPKTCVSATIICVSADPLHRNP